jgi:hypothetical protein
VPTIQRVLDVIGMLIVLLAGRRNGVEAMCASFEIERLLSWWENRSPSV